jgi:ABC-type uncharacterized transport system permease subunit
MLLYLVYGLGLGLSGAFLLLHRPRHWMRLEAVNSSGWIALMAVLFARGLALLIIRGGPSPFQGWADTVLSLGVGFAIDALLLLRLVSWMRFKRRRNEDDPPEN